jgi:cytochrome c553
MKRQLVALLAACSMMGFYGISQAADIGAGKEKAAMCVGCHGLKGISMNPEWPNIAGQKDKYLMNQLKAFRGGVRKSPLMTPIAASLSDADIENLAAYFSGLK